MRKQATTSQKYLQALKKTKKSAKQHMDQDNECYRGDDCKQANQGQQVVGKDNDAKGFNDQSKNVQQATTPTSTNPHQQTPPATCEECFAAKLEPTQLQAVKDFLGNLEVPKTIAGYCDIIDPGDESEVRRELGPVINDAAALDALIKCLQAVGVLSTSPPTA